MGTLTHVEGNGLPFASIRTWAVATTLLAGIALTACATAPAGICGDGVVQGAEGCDDGNTVTETCAYGVTACTVCGADCQPVAGATSVCGDGQLDTGHEECDAGDSNSTSCEYGLSSCTVCTPTCHLAAGAASFCGDGSVDSAHEACDPGPTVTDSCAYGLTSCSVCTASCQWNDGITSYCGDGTRDLAHEECDDGNTNPDDGCSSGCAVEAGWVCYGDPSACSRLPTCSAGSTIDGSVVITSAQDLASFVALGCTSVTGDLTIVGTALTSLVVGGALPSVESVGGTLRIAGNASLTEVVLPALAHVGSLEIELDDALTSVSLPALAEVTTVEQCTFNDQGVRTCQGGLRVGSDVILTRVSAPALATATAITLAANPLLAHVEFPALVTADHVELDACPALGSLELPALTTVGNLGLLGLGSLTTLSVPALGAATNLTLTDAASLVTLSLPELGAVTGVTVSANDALVAVEAPQLTTAQRFIVSDNPVLASLEVPGLALEGSGYFDYLKVQGNPVLSSCAALAALDRSRAGGFTGLALVDANAPSVDCAGVTSCAGPITVATGAEWSALQGRGCSEVAGDLVVQAVADDLPGALDVQIVDGVLRFTGNTAVTSLSLPALIEVFDTLQISNDGALTSVSLPALAWAALVTFESNPGVTTLGVPLLATVGALTVDANATLATLAFPALETVSFSLTIRDNPALPSCRAQAVLAQLTVAPQPGQVTITGNDASGTCSP